MLEWLLVDEDLWRDAGRQAAITAFRSIDTPMGEEAARWLREDAVANDGSTRTYALFGEQGVEGFFALAATEVLLGRGEVDALGYPARVRQPAVLLAWIARAADSSVSGDELLETAFGIARRAARDIGAIAFVLDPGDEHVAELWRRRGFRDSRPRWEGARTRLWAPLWPR
jgi:hypothetical protein